MQFTSKFPFNVIANTQFEMNFNEKWREKTCANENTFNYPKENATATHKWGENKKKITWKEKKKLFIHYS